ncbi:hypothetical protein GCM10022226_78630 [Sphaerisporangium flaviroseum]|uniref:HNH endonuclease n=1 Tax=Sphaerisporangium flaviroseum TaxID=509199 RepID=A0ABP7JH05_9ACTN
MKAWPAELLAREIIADCYPPEPTEPPMYHVSTRKRIRRHTRNKIGDRDGWTCGYCHTHVDRDLRWPHPLSPSIGHILWVGFDAGGIDDPDNLRLEHLACNMYNVPRLLVSTLGPRARGEREQAGLPPYTDDERRAIIAEALDAPPAVPRDEAMRRYWRPGMVSWQRWHTENPGACSCTSGEPSVFCRPPRPGGDLTPLRHSPTARCAT